MPRNYWMLVISAENFRITREQGVAVQGLRSALGRKAQRMEVGDRLVFYISGLRRFAAAATITSTYFEDHTSLWKHTNTEEDFPYRVRIEPSVVLEEEEWMDARQIGPRLDYVRKWTPERWPLAFVGELHLIPRNDFSLIEEEMKKVVRARARR